MARAENSATPMHRRGCDPEKGVGHHGACLAPRLLLASIAPSKSGKDDAEMNEDGHWLLLEQLLKLFSRSCMVGRPLPGNLTPN